MVLAILPPENIDELTSDYIATRWIEGIKKRKSLSACDEILHPKKLRNIYSTLNISNQKRQAASGLQTAQREYLMEKAKVTHVASLRYTYKNPELNISASLYSLTKDSSVAKRSLTQTIKVKDVEPSHFAMDAAKRFSLFLTQLIPTAVSIGYATNTFSNYYSEEGAGQRFVEIDKVKRSALPPILSSIRLENIPSRSGYNSFDWSARFVPYLNITSVNDLYTYATVDEYYLKQGDRSTIETFQYALLFYGITPNILGEISFYTPLGTLFYGFGGGPTFTYYSDSEGNEKYELNLSGIVRGGYRAFIGERWFFQVISDTQIFGAQVNNPYFISNDERNVVISVGYLMPELQREFRQTVY